MSINDLPRELTDRIVDLLDGDIFTLRSCALTCRSWLPRSQEWLHSHLRLPSESSDILEETLAQYATSPLLRKFVNRVTINVDSSEDPDWRLPLDNLASLISILFQHFPNIQDVTLSTFSVNLSAFRRKTRRIGLRVPYRSHINLKLWCISLSPTIISSPTEITCLLQSVPGLTRLQIVGEIGYADDDRPLVAPDPYAESGEANNAVAPTLRRLVLPKFRTTRDRDRFLLFLCRGRNGSASPQFALAVQGCCTSGLNLALALLGGSLDELIYNDSVDHDRKFDSLILIKRTMN